MTGQKQTRPQQAGPVKSPALAGGQVKLPQPLKGSPVRHTPTTSKHQPTGKPSKAHKFNSSDLQELESFILNLPSATNIPPAEQSAFDQLLDLLHLDDAKQAKLAPSKTGVQPSLKTTSNMND